MPVAAVLNGLGGWSRSSNDTGEQRSKRRRAALLQAGVIIAAPLVIASFGDTYIDSSGLRDVSLKQGMLRQALLPPENPVVGDLAPVYYEGIRESLHNGQFYSGLRWEYLTRLPLGRSGAVRRRFSWIW